MSTVLEPGVAELRAGEPASVIARAGRRLRLPAIDRAVVVALAMVAGAIAVRVAVIDRSLWLDETISVMQVHRPWLQVIGGQVNNVHPPLFHLLLHCWTVLFGTGAEPMRILSILWSLVAVGAVWGWSREAFRTVSPIPAAALTAFSPFAVWYATEVRMYAQLLALVALSGWLAWRIFNNGASPLRIIGLVAAVTAAVYTHYFATLFVASLAVVALTVLLRHRDLRRRALAVFGACVAAAVLLAPWVAYVLVNRSTVPSTPVFQDPDIFTVFIAGLQILIGFRPFAELGLLAAAWPLLCGLAVLLIPRYSAGSWRTIGIVAVVLLPPLILAAASLLLAHSAFDSRYLTVCAAPLYLLGGWLFSILIPSRARTLTGALLIAAAVMATLWQNHEPANPKLYELKQAVASVNRAALPGDAVLLVPQLNEASGREPILSYYRPAAGVHVVDTVGAAGAGTVAPAVMWARLQALHPGHVFIISPAYGGQPTSADAATAYDQYLRPRALRFTAAHFAHVSVRSYEPVWTHR